MNGSGLEVRRGRGFQHRPVKTTPRSNEQQRVQTMNVNRHPGDLTKGPEHRFSGDVWLWPRIGAAANTEVRNVQFTPGSRSAWHRHPAGRVLHVTEGVGVVRSRDGERQEIRAGDTTPTGASAAGQRLRPPHHGGPAGLTDRTAPGRGGAWQATGLVVAPAAPATALVTRIARDTTRGCVIPGPRTAARVLAEPASPAAVAAFGRWF